MTQAPDQTLMDLIRQRRAALASAGGGEVPHDVGEAYGTPLEQDEPPQPSAIRTLIRERRNALAGGYNAVGTPAQYRTVKDPATGMDLQPGTEEHAAATAYWERVRQAQAGPEQYQQPSTPMGAARMVMEAVRDPETAIKLAKGTASSSRSYPAGLAQTLGTASELVNRLPPALAWLLAPQVKVADAIVGGGENTPEAYRGAADQLYRESAMNQDSAAGALGGIASNSLPTIPMLLAARGNPNVAAAANVVGLGSMGVASAGQGISDYRQTVLARGEKPNPLVEAAIGAGYATAEIVFERIGVQATADILHKAAGEMGRAIVGRNAPALANYVIELAKSAGVNAGEEFATQLAQNAISQVYDPKRSMTEGADEAAIAGAMQGLGMGGGAGVLGAVQSLRRPTRGAAPSARTGTGPAGATEKTEKTPATQAGRPEADQFVRDVEARLRARFKDQSDDDIQAQIAAMSEEERAAIRREVGLPDTLEELNKRVPPAKPDEPVAPRRGGATLDEILANDARSLADRFAAGEITRDEFVAAMEAQIAASPAERQRREFEAMGGQGRRTGDEDEGGVIAAGRKTGPSGDAGGGVAGTDGDRAATPARAGSTQESAPESVVKFFRGRDNAEMRSVNNWIGENATPPDDYAGFVEAARQHPAAFEAELRRRGIQPQRRDSFAAPEQTDASTSQPNAAPQTSGDLAAPGSSAESITAAAFRDKTTGRVFEGRHHGEAKERAVEASASDNLEAGFVTSTGRFVDDYDAMQIARTAKQTTADAEHRTRLASEHLDMPERFDPRAGPFSVEWGTRSKGNSTEEFDDLDEAVAFARRKWRGSDFVTVTDRNGNEREEPTTLADQIANATDDELGRYEAISSNRIESTRGQERDVEMRRLQLVRDEQKRRRFRDAAALSDDEWLAKTRFYRSGKNKMAELPSGQKVMLRREGTTESNFRESHRDFLLSSKPKQSGSVQPLGTGQDYDTPEALRNVGIGREYAGRRVAASMSVRGEPTSDQRALQAAEDYRSRGLDVLVRRDGYGFGYVIGVEPQQPGAVSAATQSEGSTDGKEEEEGRQTLLSGSEAPTARFSDEPTASLSPPPAGPGNAAPPVSTDRTAEYEGWRPNRLRLELRRRGLDDTKSSTKAVRLLVDYDAARKREADKRAAVAATVDEGKGKAVTLPVRGAVAVAQMDVLSTVDPDDIGDGGAEARPHVTAIFGVKRKDVDAVRGIVANTPPVTIKTGATAVFHVPNSERAGGATDVLHIAVDSPGLEALHDRLSAVTGIKKRAGGLTPHITVAYLKPGAGQKYVGSTAASGLSQTIDHLEFYFTGDDGTVDKERLYFRGTKPDIGDNPSVAGLPGHTKQDQDDKDNGVPPGHTDFVLTVDDGADVGAVERVGGVVVDRKRALPDTLAIASHWGEDAASLARIFDPQEVVRVRVPNASVAAVKEAASSVGDLSGAVEEWFGVPPLRNGMEESRRVHRYIMRRVRAAGFEISPIGGTMAGTQIPEKDDDLDYTVVVDDSETPTMEALRRAAEKIGGIPGFRLDKTKADEGDPEGRLSGWRQYEHGGAPLIKFEYEWTGVEQTTGKPKAGKADIMLTPLSFLLGDVNASQAIRFLPDQVRAWQFQTKRRGANELSAIPKNVAMDEQGHRTPIYKSTKARYTKDKKQANRPALYYFNHAQVQGWRGGYTMPRKHHQLLPVSLVNKYVGSLPDGSRAVATRLIKRLRKTTAATTLRFATVIRPYYQQSQEAQAVIDAAKALSHERPPASVVRLLKSSAETLTAHDKTLVPVEIDTDGAIPSVIADTPADVLKAVDMLRGAVVSHGGVVEAELNRFAERSRYGARYWRFKVRFGDTTTTIHVTTPETWLMMNSPVATRMRRDLAALRNSGLDDSGDAVRLVRVQTREAYGEAFDAWRSRLSKRLTNLDRLMRPISSSSGGGIQDEGGEVSNRTTDGKPRWTNRTTGTSRLDTSSHASPNSVPKGNLSSGDISAGSTGLPSSQTIRLGDSRAMTPDSIGDTGAGQEKSAAAQVAVRQAVTPPPGWPERTPITGPIVYGRETTIRLANGRVLRAVYAAAEADDLLPSHNPSNGYEPNAGADKNERPYPHPTLGSASRGTVRDISTDPDQQLLLANTQTPTDGPPQATRDLRILGGNARAMALQLMAAAGRLPWQNYSAVLREAAAGFGLDGASIDKMRAPVIVRIILDDVGLPGEMSRSLNESMTTGRAPDADAVSRGAKLSKQHADRIVRLIGKNSIRETLSDADDSAKIVRVLVDAGAFSEADLVELRKPDGTLEESGKSVIEKTLLGTVVRDVDTLAGVAPSVRQKIVRSLASILRIYGAKEATGFDFEAVVRNAMTLLHDYRESGARSMEDLISQSTMRVEPWRADPRAQALAAAIMEKNQNDLATMLLDVGRTARAQQSGQATLGMGEPKTADRTFDAVFETSKYGRAEPATPTPKQAAADATKAGVRFVEKDRRIDLVGDDGKPDGRAWVRLFKNADGKYQPIGFVVGQEQVEIEGEGLPTSNYIKARVRGREWLVKWAAANGGRTERGAISQESVAAKGQAPAPSPTKTSDNRGVFGQHTEGITGGQLGLVTGKTETAADLAPTDPEMTEDERQARYPGIRRGEGVGVYEKRIGTADTPMLVKSGATPDVAPAEAPKPSGFLSNLSAADQARAEELRQKIAKKLAQQRSTLSMTVGGFDPEMLALGAEYASLHIKAGAKRFAVFAREMVTNLGDGIRPYLKALYSAARQMPGVDKAGTDSGDYVDGLADADIEAMTAGVSGPEQAAGGGSTIGTTGAQNETPGSGLRDADVGGDGRRPFGEPGVAGTGGAGGVSAGALDNSAAEDGTGQSGGRGRGGGQREGDAAGTGRVANSEPANAGGVPASTDDTGGSGGAERVSVADAARARATRHDLPPEARNHVIAPGDEIAAKSDSAKYAANIEAIELLKRIEADGDRFATPDEKKILARYTGWGWGGTIFDNTNAKQESRRKRLRELLTEEEYGAARASTTTAYYTSDAVVRPMWDLVRRLGFSGGRVLEPGAGTGNFFGMMPTDLADASSLVGVELDSLTGRILHKLYPEADVRVDGFESTRLANNSFDIAIGNVPFSGDVRPNGPDYKDLLLHDYFFARALDKVKPGGLVVFVTSDGTLNKMADGARVRGLLAEKADLVGAIRLPNNAFAENAGTEVTTDIVVLRKKDGRPFRGEPFVRVAQVGEWPVEKLVATLERRREKLWQRLIDLNSRGSYSLTEEEKAERDRLAAMRNDVQEEIERLRSKGDTIPIYANEYFAAHPEMALGTHSLAGTMYTAGDYALLPKRGTNLTETIKAAVQRLPENIMGSAVALEDASDAVELRTGERLGSYVYRPNEGAEFYVVEADAVKPADWLTERMTGDDFAEKIDDAERVRRVAVAKRWFPLRDAARVLASQERLSSASDRDIETARERLGRLYDAFVEAHGTLNHPTQQHRNPALFLQGDPDYYFVQSLEVEKQVPLDAKTGRKATRRERDLGYKIEYAKHPVFSDRQSQPVVKPTRADSAQDAVAISMGFLNRIDPDEIGGLLGVPPEEASARVLGEGLAFLDPVGGDLVPKDRYLAGNVRPKLREAVVAAQSDSRYVTNVKALEAVQPKDVEISDISLSMASRWIPASITSAFASEYFGASVDVSYSTKANGYDVTFMGESAKATEEFGIRHNGDLVFNGKQALQAALDGSGVRVSVWEGVGQSRRFRPLPDETHKAQMLVNRLSDEFQTWARTTRATVTHGGETLGVQAALARVYNEQFNGTIPINYDGSYLRLPGVTKYVRRLAHRLSVVARILQERCAVMAHGVGSGKTLSIIVSAMELRRLGLARKPMIVVQKATIGQFAAAFRAAYPQAKILVANEKTFAAKNRKRLMAQAALGDWDAVVVTQPQYERLQNHPDRIRAYIEDKMAEAREALEAEKAKKGGRGSRSLSQKRIEARIAALENTLAGILERMEKASDKASVYFQDLGVDFLFLDEAHAYKNAPIQTRRQNVKGIPSGFSLRAMNTKIKCEDIQQKRGDGTGVVLATGTPITNTMAEAYVMLDLATPNVLREYGIRNFDEFANTFGRMETRVEYTWAGAFRAVTRFAKMMNGGELVNLVRAGFDVKMGNKALGLQVPDVTGGKPELVTVAATAAYQDIADWMLEAADAFESMEPRDRREYSWVPISLIQTGAAAALDPRLVDPSAEDDPNSKINVAARRIAEKWKETTDIRGTQIVFMDRFGPMNTTNLRALTDPPSSGDPATPVADVDASDLDEDGRDGGSGDTDAAEEVAERAASAAEIAAHRSDAFNLYRDLVAKLVALGIPREQIAVVHDYNTDLARNALWEKMNAGAIRVLIGSTERVGVGVNVQARIVHAWHMDPPRSMTPAMLEQRRGRYIRQGNLFATETIDGAKNPHYIPGFTVGETMFGIAKSQDTAMYQLMENKLFFITQMLMGKVSEREFYDPTDADLDNTAAIRAALTGDPRAIRLAELQQEARELGMEQTVWERAVADRRARLDRYPGEIESRRRWVEVMRRKAASASALASERRVRVDGRAADTEEGAKTLLRDCVWHPMAADIESGRAAKPSRSFLIGDTPVQVTLSREEVRQDDGSVRPSLSYVALVTPADGTQAFTIKAPSPGAFFGGLGRYAIDARDEADRYDGLVPNMEREYAALAESPEPKFERADELRSMRAELAALEQALLATDTTNTKKTSLGLYRGQRLLLQAGPARIRSVRESNRTPGVLNALTVVYDGGKRVHDMRQQVQSIIDGAKAWETQEAAKAAAAKEETGGGAAATVLEKLDRAAAEAANRIEARGIQNRGRTSGSTTLIDDSLDLAAIVAYKAVAAGIRGGQKLTRLVADTIAALRANGTLRPSVAVDDALVRRTAKGLIRDAAKSGGDVAAAYAAAREKIDRIRTRRVGKAVGDAKGVREAVAQEVRGRPEVARPGDKREARLVAQVQQGEHREANAAAEGERAGFRQGMGVGEQVGERKTVSRAVKEITRSRREAYQAGVAEVKAAIPALVREAREMGRRKARLTTIEHRGALGAEKDRRQYEARFREGVRKLAQKLPMAVRGRFLKAVESASTPLHMVRAVRDMAKALSRHEARLAVRNLAKWTKRRKMAKLTNDERKAIRQAIVPAAQAAWKRVKAKGTTAAEMYAAARTLEDQYRRIREIYALHQAETRAIKALRGKNAEEASVEAVKNIEAARKPMKEPEREGDVEASRVTRLSRSAMDLANMTSSVEGKHDGSGVLYRLMVAVMRLAESAYFVEKRRRGAQVEAAVKRAGFKGLADAFEQLTGIGGKAFQKTVRVTLGGRERTITLGQALSLAAIDPSTEDLIERGMKIQMRSGRFRPKIAVTMDEVAELRAMLDRDHPGLRRMAQDFKGIMEEMRLDVFAVHRMLKGYEPEIVHDRWPRARNLSAGDYTQTLPESAHELVNHVLENSGFLKERTGGTDAPMLVDDVLNVVFDQIDQAAKVTHLALPVRNAANVLLNIRVREAIAARWGGAYYTTLKKMLMASSRANQVLSTPGARLVHGLNSHLAVAMLATNAGTYMRQIAGTMRLIPYLGAGDWVAGVVGASRVSLKTMTDASGYLWDRYLGNPAGRLSPVLSDGAEAMDQPGVKRGLRTMAANVRALDFDGIGRGWSQTGRAMMTGVNMADSIAARAAWAGFMRQVSREHPEWSKAQQTRWVAEKTADTIRDTQNGSSPLDLAAGAALNRDSGMAAWFLFTSDPLKARNRIARAWKKSAADGMKQTGAEAASILVGVALARGAGWTIASAVSKALGGDDDDQDRINALFWSPERVLAAAAREVFGLAVPIVGDSVGDRVSRLAMKGMFDVPLGKSGDDAFTPPAIEALNNIWAAADGLGRAAVADEDRGVKATKAFMDALEVASQTGGNPLHAILRVLFKEVKYRLSDDTR